MKVRLATLAVVLALGLLAAPLAAEAQQIGKVYRLGSLSPSSGPLRSTRAFSERLGELGYVEGQNIQIEHRWAGTPERFPALAEELARLDLDVIVAWTGAATRAVLKTTTRTPIVAASDDLVRGGLVKSSAHPGGRVTGFQTASPELVGKRLQLLKEAAPRIARVAVLRCPVGTAAGDVPWSEAETAARTLGVTLVPVVVASSNEVRGAVNAVKRMGADALLALDCYFRLVSRKCQLT